MSRSRNPKLAGLYTRVSGFSLRDCVTLGGRHDAGRGYRPPDAETWVVKFSPGRLDTLFWAQRGWLTGVWYSESKRIYVSDIERKIHHRDPSDDPGSAEAWSTHAVPINPTGIWGLRDDFIVTWGLGEKGAPAVMRWDGAAWRRIGSPAFVMSAIHGPRPDLLFAVGDDGRIARWNGTEWTEMTTPAKGTLVSVFAVGDDEVYACGLEGELLRGSTSSWTKLLDAGVALHSVAKWRDEVYVGAAAPRGLCKLEGGELAPFGKSVAMQIDPRAVLLLTTNEKIVANDGQEFKNCHVQSFVDAVRNDPPSWH